ncbi:MAG: hypothetical protein JXA57_07780 [Armatimonadetes bacterium]|nr:hypothetical protein [Armatimonadota bacterium]
MGSRERLHAVRRKSFTEEERSAIMGDVADIAEAIYREIADKTTRGRATAQRRAIETWLKKEKLIIVTQGSGVLPSFSPLGSQE